MMVVCITPQCHKCHNIINICAIAAHPPGVGHEVAVPPANQNALHQKSNVIIYTAMKMMSAYLLKSYHQGGSLI